MGFAAETRDVLANARTKLTHKGVNMMVANQVGGDQDALGNDRNTVTVIHAEGEIVIPEADKYAVAIRIFQEIGKLLDAS